MSRKIDIESIDLQLRPLMKSYVAKKPCPFTESSDLNIIVIARDVVWIVGGFWLPQYLPIDLELLVSSVTILS